VNVLNVLVQIGAVPADPFQPELRAD